MKPLILLLACAAAAWPQPVAPAPSAGFVQAVEFPYYLLPRANWERELVWLKSIGIDTVEFPIPWNWHQLQPGDLDFTGRTSPRRDLAGFIRILRKLGLRAWIRPLPPIAGWLNEGWPAGAHDERAQRAWLKQLQDLLATQTQAHGGPVAFVEGASLAIDAAAAPSPVSVVSATDPGALARSRDAISAGHGAVLWVDVEDRLYPGGWEPGSSALLRKGAVDLGGEERSPTSDLRRDAALLHNWSPLLAGLRRVRLPKADPAKLPAGVRGVELISPAVSAVSLVNRGSTPFDDDLRVLDPASRRVLVVPSVRVPAGGALWLPLDVSLGPDGLCRECSNFSGAEHIIYATAELQTIEFENGILAMEFAAPQPAEVILQLAREPVGPYLAAGKPTKFDWDDKTLRVRLPIPAGKGEGNHVRVGLAIEEPETSAFFTEARRLVIGQKNLVSTVYSAPDVAARSRLRLPEGFTATASKKSPNEIDYNIAVPAEALHGDWASMALEADGLPLGRARVQLFRPVSIRLSDAMRLHFGPTPLMVDPATAPAQARSGTDLELILRNNSPQIQTYRLEPSGPGLEFSPRSTEISIGAASERPVSFRVFGAGDAAGLAQARLRVSGAAGTEWPFHVVLLPRSGAVAWSADLDGDGYAEWVLESQKVRAVFSSRDGGRWIEFTWKDTDTNFLPEGGAFSSTGAVQVQARDGALEFRGNGWTRTVRLADTALTVEEAAGLPPDFLVPQTSANVNLSIDRESKSRVVYRLSQSGR
ncbi:MAG TPA: beta-galactosidase [Bryobacteraceae bacterium]|nr:beta-galactosidase [Bryobacteraceae bacterium]